jgi:tRNA(adenine34) deaminase
MNQPNISQKNDTHFMSLALKEAKKSLLTGDIPIGALIVKDEKIIARAHNEVEKRGDPTAHAEMMAIKKAVKKNNYKFLLDCTLYVTLEPCCQCSGSIVLARIPRLVIGAKDPKTGASGSLYEITQDSRLNHRCEVISGVMEKECSQILKEFFRMLRNGKK